MKKSMVIDGFQHFPLTEGSHAISGGLHCRQSRITLIVDPIMTKMARLYRKYFWNLLGFKSLTNSTATPSLGMEKDIIPGMKAMLFHFMALENFVGPR